MECVGCKNFEEVAVLLEKYKKQNTYEAWQQIFLIYETCPFYPKDYRIFEVRLR
jgi:hypothetical protein